jgi:hypothetical protein
VRLIALFWVTSLSGNLLASEETVSNPSTPMERRGISIELSPSRENSEENADNLANSSTFYACEVPKDSMTPKEIVIFSKMSQRPHTLFINNSSAEPPFGIQLRAVVALQQKITHGNDEIKLDNLFLPGNKIGPSAATLGKIAQFLETSILFLDIGTNRFGCMDIIKRIFVVKFDSDTKEISESFNRTSRISDRKLLEFVENDNENALLLCWNSHLDRMLFSLPGEQDISDADILPAGQVEKSKKSILRMGKVRSCKNAALVIVPSAVAVSVGLYFAIQYWPTITGFFSSVSAGIYKFLCPDN